MSLSRYEYSRMSIKYKAPEIEFLHTEAARDQALEDAVNLTDDEKEEITEQTRIDSKQATTEAAAQRKHDALGEWLDYLYPPKDEKRIADSEIY